MQIKAREILIVDLELQLQAAHYLNQGQYTEAITIYEHCIEANPTNISNYWYLGLALLLQGEEFQAQSVWLSVIVQGKSDEIEAWTAELINVLELEAHRQFQLGNLLEAQKICLQILEQKPNHAKAYRTIGTICFYQNQLDEASAYFYKAIEAQPDFAEAYNDLGIILQKQLKFEESIFCFRKAIENKPDFSEARHNLGFILEIIKGQQAGYSPGLRQGYRTWDSWLFKDGDTYRLFYLTTNKQVPEFWSVGEVGSAISADMKKWDYLGVVLQPDPEREWESGRILAGNVYKENGIYYLFYPASPPEPLILQESIGLATSIDGLHWERCPSLLLKPDNCLYGSCFNFQFNRGEHFQWRDPYIVKDPNNHKYYMFITATTYQGHSCFKGCVGLAVSNKIDGPYELLPPAAYPLILETEESIYYEMERSQVIYKNGKYHMFFSCRAHLINPVWLERVGRDTITDSSLYWYVSDKITGPFKPLIEKPVVKGSENTGLYGTNFIIEANGDIFAYGWYSRSFTLEVSQRFPVVWENDCIEILLGSVHE